ncbi:SMI1/KNR4 family protein, partial [Micromonospora sp. MS34]|uniref:SMI1/KNR4 family protein n=1 Tax=Micromonospora sp. MS34 TaxID=3385971 RepID=UPI0039A1C91D
SCLNLMYQRNGGVLRNTCHPTSFRTYWPEDHFAVDVILGIGHDEGVDACSADLVAEWGYPDVGVVIGVTPAAGHDTVMLDYSVCGPQGEPAVAYVDEDRVPRRVAGSFAELIGGLVSCEAFEGEDR